MNFLCCASKDRHQLNCCYCFAIPVGHFKIKWIIQSVPVSDSSHHTSQCLRSPRPLKCTDLGTCVLSAMPKILRYCTNSDITCKQCKSETMIIITNYNYVKTKNTSSCWNKVNFMLLFPGTMACVQRWWTSLLWDSRRVCVRLRCYSLFKCSFWAYCIFHKTPNCDTLFETIIY